MALRINTQYCLAVLGILLGYTHFADSFQVTLLDTRQEEVLDWVTNQATGSQTNSRRGWREASYNSQGDVFRVYTVCNIVADNVDNWLRVPYIERGHANRLYIEMKFTMRRCIKYPDPGRLQQCKESFQLLFYEAESDFGNSERPTWDRGTYTQLDVIAADKTFTDIDESIINTETRDVTITRKGVYFAIQDQGACTTLISVRIYYIMCPSVILNFTLFPNTTTGQDRSSVISQNGVCVSHAAMDTAPSYLCKGDGTWTLLTGGCKCMPGYEPDGHGNDQACRPCSPGTYKWRTGTEACRACPAYSEAPRPGAVECGCQQGYYRSIHDDKGMPCTKPPSSVRNLTVIYMDQSQVDMAWQEPSDLGGRRDLYYSVQCRACGTLVKYTPGQRLNNTRVILQGLAPSTQYKLEVIAENGVSDRTVVKSAAEIFITTEDAIPAKVARVRVTNIGLSSVSLAWDPPTEMTTEIDQYEVRYVITDRDDLVNHTLTTNQNVTVTRLARETEYAFTVRAHTSKGWGEYSEPIYANTDSKDIVKQRFSPTTPPDNPVGIIAGSAVAVVVCMVIVIVMVIIVVRRYIQRVMKKQNGNDMNRHHRPCNEKNVSDCDTLQYSNVQCPHILDGSHVMNGGLTIPLFTPPGSVKTYVDPHTYEDPQQAVREFTKEIDVSFITIESVIGGGEFGDVCKGRFRLAGKMDKTVAIKTLKAGASDKNRLDFLTEASIMGQFDDQNVIYLEGVVTKSNPIMIVTEFMENGSLDTFLRSNDGQFTNIQLVGMLRGIASGMRYLSEMGYVHRDLAARNILVNEAFICKVADFGLSREVESDNTDGAYTTKGGKIPVRWTAPEAIAYRKFTSASDAWSYGVVMWEIISYGERPYWNWSNHRVISEVDNGFRLPPPMDCPALIYDMMLECWHKDRNHRPKFSALVPSIDKLIRAPDQLDKIAQPHEQLAAIDPGSPSLSGQETVDEWLTAIKMDRYLDAFISAGYQSMDQVAQIQLKDLLALGITLVGHQKKIINSVQTLRARFFNMSPGVGHMSDGFLV